MAIFDLFTPIQLHYIIPAPISFVNKEIIAYSSLEERLLLVRVIHSSRYLILTLLIPIIIIGTKKRCYISSIAAR